MNEIETIPVSDMDMLSVEYEGEVTTLCEVTEVPFYARVQVSYLVKDRLLEFETFDRWLKSLAEQKMTIEGLAVFIHKKLYYLLNLDKEHSLNVSLDAITIVHGRTRVDTMNLLGDE